MDYWDPYTEAFILDGMALRLEVEETEFIIRVFHRGKIVNLWARRVGKGLTIEEYIVVYCIHNTENIGSQVSVNVI